MTRAGPTAIGAAEFAAMMAGLGPFETAPALATAVSGGRDSRALALLAAEWAAARGGSVLGLTVDHGLRPESAAEARQVAAWLRRLGMPHRTLAWRGAKPASGLQEAARHARYRLLEGACRERGILHLLIGHQLQDQLVTYLMRQARRSGPYGLAAMSPVRLEGGVRLLRPLLGVDRARLTATLEARGQPWIDDPSNADPRFERTRLERQLAVLAPGPAGRARLAEVVRRAGAERAALEGEALTLAARSVRLSGAGFALLAPEPVMAAGAEVRAALLRRLIMTVGGKTFAPRQERLARFFAAFEAAPGRLSWTLGGCRVAPWRGRLAFSRELRHLEGSSPVLPGAGVRWDRFECRLAAAPAGRYAVAMLGREGWHRVRAHAATLPRELPDQVPASLPALWDGVAPVAVPHLGYCRSDRGKIRFSADFRPLQPLAPEPFAVASAGWETI